MIEMYLVYLEALCIEINDEMQDYSHDYRMF